MQNSGKRLSPAIDTWPRTLGVVLVAVVLLFAALPAAAQSPAPIPEASITPLDAELVALKTSRASSSSRRRACKGIIRTAQSLIKAQPTAPNRFDVLALILKAQQHLLGMEKNQRNRDAFYDTCNALMKAPDAYSMYRFNADILLSDRDLSAKNANAAERTKALTALVQRYRNTSAELESLVIAIRLAPQLGAYELKKTLVTALNQRFAGDPKAISFRRTLMGASRMDVLFSGTYKRLDGTSMVFPQDRLGHPYFVIFWSKNSPLALEKLKQLKDQQDAYPELLEFYSLNIDELADGGKSVLDKIGLKCTVLRLPGGTSSLTFRTYALYHPTALRVNQFGHAIVPPTTEAHKKNMADELTGNDHLRQGRGFDDFAFPLTHGYKLGLEDCDRYISQIRSLLIGDALVHSDGVSPVLDETSATTPAIMAVRECFLAAPMRYRMTKAKEFANYQKANNLCVAAMATHPKAADVWRLRNYRIIALLGMANLRANPADRVQAVNEARMAISKPLPKGGQIIPRFCLAIDAIRSGSPAKTVLEEFLSHCGGTDAGPIANSAACILAMHADSRDLYEGYRTAVLAAKALPPGLDSVVSFLRDRYHQLYVFKGSTGFYLYDRVSLRFPEQNHIVNNTLTPMTDPLPPFKVRTLDGKMLSLPITNTDQLTVIVFVEPPVNGNELPPQIYNPPAPPTKRRPNPKPGGELGAALAVEKDHTAKGVNVVTVFLTDDVNQVKAIRDTYALSGTITVLPGALTHPIINRLGILSADRFVNTMLIRRNGTIAWRKHGLVYQMNGKHRIHVAANGLRHNITTCAVEAGYRALKAKDYKRAKHMFSEALGETVEGNHKWNSTLAHGRALATMALKDYETALTEIDSAIQKHLHKNQFNHDSDAPCTSMLHLYTTKAKILDALGRKSEARAARNKAAVKPTDYPTFYGRVRGFDKPYEVFETKLSIIAKEIN